MSGRCPESGSLPHSQNPAMENRIQTRQTLALARILVLEFLVERAVLASARRNTCSRLEKQSVLEKLVLEVEPPGTSAGVVLVREALEQACSILVTE